MSAQEGMFIEVHLTHDSAGVALSLGFVEGITSALMVTNLSCHPTSTQSGSVWCVSY